MTFLYACQESSKFECMELRDEDFDDSSKPKVAQILKEPSGSLGSIMHEIVDAFYVPMSPYICGRRLAPWVIDQRGLEVSDSIFLFLPYLYQKMGDGSNNVW